MTTKKTSYQRRIKKTLCLYVDPEVKEAIQDLAAATRISQSEYLREALDDLLLKYKRQLNAYYKKEGTRK